MIHVQNIFCNVQAVPLPFSAWLHQRCSFGEAGIADKTLFALADNSCGGCGDDTFVQQDIGQFGQILCKDSVLQGNAGSGDNDGQFHPFGAMHLPKDEWLLMSIRHYEQHPNVEYPVAIENCYAINTQTKEVKELNIKQEIAEDRTIPIMLGQSATDLLLITDSQTDNVEHYGFEYSIISKEGYLNSDVAELRKVSFIEDGSNVS